MNSYTLPVTPRIVVGPDALAALAPLAQRAQVGSVVVIADAAVGHLVPRLEAALGAWPCTLHLIPPHEPTTASVDAATRVARAAPAPLIVGLGGGSALDTAKLVAALCHSGHPAEHHLLGARPFVGRRPLAALPTTAGTGAEVTRVCVVSDPAGRKLWAVGDALLPDAALLMPTFTATVPPHLSVSTALDALVHAVEACTGRRRNALASASALQAIRLIRSGLPQVLRVPDDLAARQTLQEAALLAGLAFDHSALGVAHALGHALGTLHHLPHGVAVALALDASLAWNLEAAGEDYAPVAQAFGVPLAGLPAALTALYDQVGFGSVVARHAPLDLDPAALAETIGAPENRPLLDTNAREVRDEDRLVLGRLTLAAWRRWTAAPSG